ncbi:MAG: hypothetical protein OXL96_22425 [Candidatus Poribacteria bacterium]|nr:hypothetical protein [Candidatus Poribacteria bacterium]
MKGHSTFHILVLLVVLLTFSSHTVFGRGPRPTKPKAKRKQISAEIQAKRDAEADLNKRLWIGAGCTVVLLPPLGCFAGSLGPQSYSGASNLSDQKSLGLCIGSTLALGTLILTSRHQPTPPPERFIGKSPEYISVYTDVYKKRTQWLKAIYATAGQGIGWVIAGVLGHLISQITENL